MPTYDYICKKCDEKFEHFQSMSSPSLKVKPGCLVENCEVVRIISGGTGLIFKGSGFYLTDYKNKKSEKKEIKSDKPKNKNKKSKKTKNIKE